MRVLLRPQAAGPGLAIGPGRHLPPPGWEVKVAKLRGIYDRALDQSCAQSAVARYFGAMKCDIASRMLRALLNERDQDQ